MSYEMVGKRIRELRKNKGLTQAKMANMISMSKSTISKFECGTQLPSLGQLDSISEVLGVTIDYIVRGSKDDDETQILKFFSDEFDVITTSDKYINDIDTYSYEEMLTANGNYIVLKGQKRLFSLLSDLAEIGKTDKKTTANNLLLIRSAWRKYQSGKESEYVKRLLLSFEQLREIEEKMSSTEAVDKFTQGLLKLQEEE